MQDIGIRSLKSMCAQSFAYVTKTRMRAGVQYFVLYASVSVALLSLAIYTSLEVATNQFTFLLEMADGYNMPIFINSIIFSYFTLFNLIQWLIFGELRAIEAEHLVEIAPSFVNLLLSLTTSDNVILNCIIIGLAMSFRAFYSILSDRMDFVHMKIINSITTERHTSSQVLMKFIRCLYFWLIFLFALMDFTIAYILVCDLFLGVNSVMCLLFGFDFAMQGIETSRYSLKMLLNIYEDAFYVIHENTDISNYDMIDDGDSNDDDEIVWENKVFLTKGIDTTSFALMAVLHLSFMYLLKVYSGVSLHISMLQGTYVSIKQLCQEVSQLVTYLKSSKRLESHLPNATAEDLANDRLCIICREDMLATEEYEIINKKVSPRKCPKKLRCNHNLHRGCLKDWLERSENCPLCRRNIFQTGHETTGTTQAAQSVVNHTGNPERTLFREENYQDQRTYDSVSEQGHTYHEQGEQHNILNEFQLPAGPPYVSSSTSSFSCPDELSAYQTIRLPSNAVIPPDWTILPLNKINNMTYTVNFSHSNKGNLTVRPRSRDNNVTLIEPSI